MDTARTIKLGKRPPRYDKRTLRMHRYISRALPPPPPSVNWTRGFTSIWSMALNDSLGDCVEAGKEHAVAIWSLNTGRLVTIPDSVVLAAYARNGGYVPGDDATDQGEVEIDSLNDWRKSGFGGVELLAYASLDPTNVMQLQQAVYLFGAAYLGIELPITAQEQLDAGQVWDVTGSNGPDAQPGSWGGHCLLNPQFGSRGMTAITWGRLQSMTWGFITKYTTEAYALLSPAWLRSGNVDPSGINLADLQRDLNSVTA